MKQGQTGRHQAHHRAPSRQKQRVPALAQIVAPRSGGTDGPPCGRCWAQISGKDVWRSPRATYRPGAAVLPLDFAADCGLLLRALCPGSGKPLLSA